MKVQICSDLHLEFADNRRWLENHPLIPKADILIIAGDTYYLNRSYHKLDFIKQVSREFQAVYLIPGNHEYYEGFDAQTALEPMEVEILDNVFMVNNKTITIDEVNFIFSTMWSNVSRYVLPVYRGLVDFRRIKFDKEPLSVAQYNLLHSMARTFLKEELLKEGKKVVVTHHMPSELCNVKEFEGSIITEAFLVEMKEIIEPSDVRYWIYGHSHRNKQEFTIGNTTLLTNQFGYVGYNEHHAFDYSKVIEL